MESWQFADPTLIVLGVAQDGGHPQAGCSLPCCAPAWADARLGHFCACLAIADPESGKRWMFDATPDFPAQLHALDQVAPVQGRPGLDGIFLTHGHIGHYTGLMHLGREVMGATGVGVHAMPKMAAFLRKYGPWELLTRLNNVVLHELSDRTTVPLSPSLEIQPIAVPHRSEYTETVGFILRGPTRSALYLPDIDKWHRWRDAERTLAEVDLAFIDGTFFSADELDRPLEEIPHPTVGESIAFFGGLPTAQRNKIHFLHFNHTNPLLQPEGEAHAMVHEAGMHLATQGQRFSL